MIRLTSLMALGASLVACGSEEGIPGYGSFEKQVEREQVGTDRDQWIEMRNMMGEWERTGLIFGYADDYEECQKAVAGLRQANVDRDYRCVPAN